MLWVSTVFRQCWLGLTKDIQPAKILLPSSQRFFVRVLCTNWNNSEKMPVIEKSTVAGCFVTQNGLRWKRIWLNVLLTTLCHSRVMWSSGVLILLTALCTSSHVISAAMNNNRFVVDLPLIISLLNLALQYFWVHLTSVWTVNDVCWYRTIIWAFYLMRLV